ncbi:MAG: hypothetical protein A2293_05760 [Elusimicrobia bacterium RIFOXYB2_FULL_49_7]|nr:MAG: hypothetical protein A2293_05760 [Elusimicrobia bacterium RIFOXYB2_FULL_49_7]
MFNAEQLASERGTLAQFIRSMQKIQKYFEVVDVLIVVLNPQREIVFINNQGCAMLGYKLEELAGKKWFSLCVPERLQEGVRAVFEKLVNGDWKQYEQFEHCVLTRNYEEKHFAWQNLPLRDTEGTVVGVVSVGHDISRFKKTEEDLAKSRDHYLELFEGLPVLIWKANSCGKRDFFNSSWLKFTGRQLYDEAHDGWLVGMHEQDRAAYALSFTTSFAQRAPFQVSYRLKNTSGQYRWLHESATPFYGADRVFSGFIGVCVDVTEARIPRTHEEKPG